MVRIWRGGKNRTRGEGAAPGYNVVRGSVERETKGGDDGDGEVKCKVILVSRNGKDRKNWSEVEEASQGRRGWQWQGGGSMR
jgi:hypothetical protein